MARVSVIVRTKDRPWFLARALKDIAAQTFETPEVVVVNDGGDQATAESVVSQSPLSGRARLVHIAPGEGGRCRAANEGVAASTGSTSFSTTTTICGSRGSWRGRSSGSSSTPATSA